MGFIRVLTLQLTLRLRVKGSGVVQGGSRVGRGGWVVWADPHGCAPQLLQFTEPLGKGQAPGLGLIIYFLPMSYCREWVGRVEEGREGWGGVKGRDQKMYCGISKSGFFSSFPSLFPHPQLGLAGDLPVRIGGIFHHTGLWVLPQSGPLPPPQPSAPIWGGQSTVGSGVVALVTQWGKKLHCLLALG